MERHRAAVYHRDWQVCVASALGSCWGGLTLQHRVNRGMGGSKAVGAGPHWYVTMCAGHNMLIEQDPDVAAVARVNGWTLRPAPDMERMALDYPVRYPDGTWWRLHADGRREPCWDAKSALVRAQQP